MRKGRGQVDNLFIISGYFLLLSRAESVCTIESKHEVDVVKEMQGRPERCATARRPGDTPRERNNDSHIVINVQSSRYLPQGDIQAKTRLWQVFVLLGKKKVLSNLTPVVIFMKRGKPQWD